MSVRSWVAGAHRTAFPEAEVLAVTIRSIPYKAWTSQSFGISRGLTSPSFVVELSEGGSVSQIFSAEARIEQPYSAYCCPPRSMLTVQGAGFRVQSSDFRVQSSGFRVQGSGFRVQGSGFRFWSLELRV